MLDGTYAGLKASVADWLNRSDLTLAIPDFIANAEAEISRTFVMQGAPREMVARAVAQIDNEFENLPSDFMGARALYLEGSQCPLEMVEPEEIARRRAQVVSPDGNPRVYAIVGFEIQFWPPPTSQMYLDLVYIRRIPSLNDSITANWLLTLHPDCYLYGSLLQAAPYLRDDDRIQVWQSRFTQIITSICEAGKRAQSAPYLGMPKRWDIA